MDSVEASERLAWESSLVRAELLVCRCICILGGCCEAESDAEGLLCIDCGVFMLTAAAAVLLAAPPLCDVV